MQTSGISRRTEVVRCASRGAPRVPAPRAATLRAATLSGFTLLEIIVVLAIMGMVAAIATPAVVRGIDTWRRQAQADALMDQLRGLPSRARAAGRPIEISAASLAGESAPLVVDPGWTLAVPVPWLVQANGVCQGGSVELHGDDGRILPLQATSPFCDPQVANAE